MISRSILYLFVLLAYCTHAQQQDFMVLSFGEYLAYVKKYHPIAKQAALNIASGQANLMRSRGAFDPTLEIDYDRKKFKGTDYYERLNTTFKIPTWYGVELKAKFDRNDGVYLNPEETTPDGGLFSAGISMSVGQGFWINERMATLRRAKFFAEQSKAERDIQVNQILFEASLAYFDWLKAYQDNQIYTNFLTNAEIRFKGIKSSALAGELAAIDTLEAKIAVQDRELNLEQTKVRLMKATLELSNFLWMANNIPVELQSAVIPDTKLEGVIDTTLEISGKPLDSFTIENHPKLKSLGYKIDGLSIEQRLKANKLWPKIDLEYNFLTDTPEYLNSFETPNFKGGVSFKLPLFLRKERGDLKLAQVKLQYAEYEYDNAEIQLKNKIVALYKELESFQNQNYLADQMVENYRMLTTAEERKFSFGESSLFLINSRESKLIDAVLKQNSVRNKFFSTKAKLFNSIGTNPKNL